MFCRNCKYLISSFTLKRYHKENRNLLYGDFRFGPLFMRLCYELGLEGMAAATITDEVRIVMMEVPTVNKAGSVTLLRLVMFLLFLHRISKDFSSTPLLLTSPLTCYLSKAYMKVSNRSNCWFLCNIYNVYIIWTLVITDAMDVLRTMKHQDVPFNKDTVMLATGTFYKLVIFETFNSHFNLILKPWDLDLSGVMLVLISQNTADSYKNCTDLIEEQQAKAHIIPLHAYCFAIALALKQVSCIFFLSMLKYMIYKKLTVFLVLF